MYTKRRIIIIIFVKLLAIRPISNKTKHLEFFILPDHTMKGFLILQQLMILSQLSLIRSQQIANPIQLSNDIGTQLFFTPMASGIAHSNFTRAVAPINAFPPSMWLIYNEENFDVDHVSNGGVMVQDEEVDYGRTIKSIQGFNVNNPGIILFSHFAYRGFGLPLQFSNPNITAAFPPGERNGLSSVIVMGGTWSFYSDVEYNNTISIEGRTQFGKGMYNLWADGNDVAKSVQLVGA